MAVTKEQWRELNEMLCRNMPRFEVSSFIDSLGYYHKMFCGEYYDSNNLKGKKMSQIYEVVAIQEHEDKNPTILVPITTVVAKDNQTAVQNFLIENAAELTGKENVQTLCRPFC